MKISLLITLSLLCLNAQAQQRFTDRLQRSGLVKLIQDEAITNLVNGKGLYGAATSSSSYSSTTASNATSSELSTAGTTAGETAVSSRALRKMTMSGYRVQVFSGGNSRQSKQQAEQTAYRVRSAMGSSEAVYTNFISPRWVCRMGDYRSYEEAYQAMRRLKAAGDFSDAVIVKSKVQVIIE